MLICAFILRSWLRSAVSLLVIMGLTWIVGVLVVEVEELLPLAYIFTILVAFQGVFIFLVFVLLSQKVRETYTKWWRVRVTESDTLSRLFGDKTGTSKSVKKKSKKNVIFRVLHFRLSPL